LSYQGWWKNCQQCEIASWARQKVFVRVREGSNPALVFIGEGPGKAEDVLGLPFVGPAGQFLDAAIEAAGLSSRKCIFLNLVACRPCDGVGMGNRKPTEGEILKCRPRLVTALAELEPVVVVLLGKTVQQSALTALSAVDWWGSVPVLELPHPSALLRRGGRLAEDYPVYVRKLKEVTDLG